MKFGTGIGIHTNAKSSLISVLQQYRYRMTFSSIFKLPVKNRYGFSMSFFLKTKFRYSLFPNNVNYWH